MNKYDPAKVWYFELYTYFGRTVKRFPIGMRHEDALNEARYYSRDCGFKTWMRLIT